MSSEVKTSQDFVEFVASFPPILSAIKVDGQGGMRIQLDVPETEMGNAAMIILWRQMRLKVRIEVLQDITEAINGESETNERTTFHPFGMVGC